MRDLDADRLRAIDAVSKEWRQGDCVLGELWFVFGFAHGAPITDEARAVAQGEAGLAEQRVRGFVVATQTCDLVRDCLQRSFLEVCPLTEVTPAVLEEVRQGRRIRYAYLPGVAQDLLVADLDRALTLEKGVLLDWQRTEGCPQQEDGRAFARTLVRKHSRFAFPDDFANFVRPLSRRMQEKHKRPSREGDWLRAIREIRARVAPHWNASEVAVTFFLLLDVAADLGALGDIEPVLEAWSALAPPTERFATVEFRIARLEDITAREYVESEALDLEHLSHAGR